MTSGFIRSAAAAALAFTAALGTLAPRAALAGKPIYTVLSCNDGDTCRLKGTDDVTLKVRLVGIDAPEFGGGKPGKGRKKQGQPFSAQSKDKLNALVQGKQVSLNTLGIDIYNRNLAEILVEGQNVNLELVRGGFAEMYKGKPPKGLDVGAYAKAEAEARAAKRGVWSLDAYESPKDFRRRTK